MEEEASGYGGFGLDGDALLKMHAEAGSIRKFELCGRNTRNTFGVLDHESFTDAPSLVPRADRWIYLDVAGNDTLN
jgi:hypothetical protein